MIEGTVTRKSKNPTAPKLFPDEMIDQPLAQVQGESILGESGLAGQLKKQLAERMLAAELRPRPSKARPATTARSLAPRRS